MTGPLAHDIQEEADLIARFVRSYRPRFAAAIDVLNRHRADIDLLEPELQSLRLCVEAMDMVLVNQDRMAGMLRRLSNGGRPTLKAA